MHTLLLNDTVVLRGDEIVPSGEYLVEDLNGCQLMRLAGGGKMNFLEEKRPLDETKNYNGKSILVALGGGFGALVLLTPVLLEIKRLWPDCNLTVATFDRYKEVLVNLPFIDEVVDYPIAKDLAEDFAAWIFYPERAVRRRSCALRTCT